MTDKEIVTDDLKAKVKDSNVWVRLLFMLLFFLIYSVAEVVLGIVVFFQFLYVLFTGNKNEKALSLGAQLSSFVYQVFRYLTYNSDERPFPFADWPSDASLAEQKPIRKPAPGRSATKNSAAKKAAKSASSKE